jgi:hypothetical protein
MSESESLDTTLKERGDAREDDENREPCPDAIAPHRSGTQQVAASIPGLRSLLRLLLFGFAGVVIGLHTIARTTLPHIVSTAQGMDYQNVVDGQPIPHLLDWNQTQIDTLTGLRNLNGLPFYVVACVLWSLLTLVAIRMLNPGFRLFRVNQHKSEPDALQPALVVRPTPQPDAISDITAAHESPGGGSEANPAQETEALAGAKPTPAALSASIEPVGLFKTATILALVALPVAICWLLTSRANTTVSYTISTDAAVGRWGWVWAIRMPVLFAALWLGFHRRGLAGDSESRALNFEPTIFPRIIVQGAVIGLLAFLIGRYGVPGALEPILLRYQTLGAFNLDYWHEIVAAYLLCMATAWFAVGSLFLLANRPNSADQRGLIVLAVLGLVIAIPFKSNLGADSQTTRYSITPQALKSILYPYAPDRNGTGVPDGPGAAALLASHIFKTNNVNSPLPERNVLMFRDDSYAPARRVGTTSIVTSVIQNGITTDGLPATLESAARATEFLRLHRFQSALSWVATKHRYDVATLHFDTTAALTACLDDLSYGPHPFSRNPMARLYRRLPLQIEETTQALFCICAANPRNLALLRRWADVVMFAFPDRQSKRVMGDLFRRFGDVEDALVWYRRADMPRTFLARIRAEQPLFHTGHVEGTLRLNGRPLAGVQVGLAPSRLNGLPRGLEGTVNGAIFEMEAEQPGGPQFDAFHPLPNAFRWISGSDITDANGHFAIDDLTEGEYVLICTLPAEVHVTIPTDMRLHVSNAPLPFILLYGTPKINLGIIDIDI